MEGSPTSTPPPVYVENWFLKDSLLKTPTAYVIFRLCVHYGIMVIVSILAIVGKREYLFSINRQNKGTVKPIQHLARPFSSYCLSLERLASTYTVQSTV